MKSWFKSLLVLPLLGMLVACSGQLMLPDQPSELTSNTGTVSEAVPPPIVEEEAVDLSYLKQRFIQHAVLLYPNWPQMADANKKQALKGIVISWRKAMGDVNPDTMEYNLENVNRFLQFIRLSAGEGFHKYLVKTFEVNEAAHSLLRMALVEHDASLFDNLESRIVGEHQPAMKFKMHILAVAQIYGVKFEDAPVNPQVAKAQVQELVSRIEAEFNVQIADNKPIPVRLTELYDMTTLGVQGAQGQFTFLPFGLVGDDFVPEDGIQRFQMSHSIYGAVFLKDNSYVREAN